MPTYLESIILGCTIGSVVLSLGILAIVVKFCCNDNCLSKNSQVQADTNNPNNDIPITTPVASVLRGIQPAHNRNIMVYPEEIYSPTVTPEIEYDDSSDSEGNNEPPLSTIPFARSDTFPVD
jgi:hypothetical protein